MKLVNGIAAGSNIVKQSKHVSTLEGNVEHLPLTRYNQVVIPFVSIVPRSSSNTVENVGETSYLGRVISAKKKDTPKLNVPMIAGPLIIREGAHLNKGMVTKLAPTEGKVKGKVEDDTGGLNKTGLMLRKRNRHVTVVESNTRATNEQVPSDMVLDTVNGGPAAEENTATVRTNPLFTENIVMAEAESQPAKSHENN